jgi:hypothetical protein
MTDVSESASVFLIHLAQEAKWSYASYSSSGIVGQQDMVPPSTELLVCSVVLSCLQSAHAMEERHAASHARGQRHCQHGRANGSAGRISYE